MDYAEFDARCLASTDNAILVELDQGGEVWVPRSLLADGRNELEEKGDEGQLVVARWFAEKEGLL